MGQLIYFCVEDWKIANEYKHAVGITDIFVDPAGTRLIYFDIKRHGFLYSAVSCLMNKELGS